MVQIHTRHAVAAAYRRALAFDGTTHAEAIASAAQALGLAPEAVQDAITSNDTQQHADECTA